MQKVLLIDDDVEIYRLIKNYVGDAFQFLHTPSLKDAESYLAEEVPHLILLDINLEDGDGLEFLLKKKSMLDELKISIIMLTKSEELAKKLESFELGAVDYVSKPFQAMELIARIKSNLKRQGSGSHILTKKDIAIDLLANRVTITHGDQKEILDLSPIEFKLLTFFFNNEDHIYSREQLMDNVWGETINVTDRTVDQHVSKLRKKLKSQFFGIKTNHGQGYSFTQLRNM